MFPDFFETYGGTYGINVKDRLVELAPRSKGPWIASLSYIGGSGSPTFRYLLHIDASVDRDSIRSRSPQAQRDERIGPNGRVVPGSLAGTN